MKTLTNYIYEYYQKINDGTIIVGKWVKLVYDIIIDDIKNKKYTYDAKKAKKAILYIEHYCRHHEGELAPQHLKLELWQKALVSCIFGLVDDDGNRHYREIMVIIARKNGKSLLASAISSYMLYLDDYGARVYFVAPKLQQANLCYDALYQMIKKEPELSRMTKKRRTDIYVDSTNSSAMPLAFNAKKSDGLNVSFGCCDEISSWAGDAGLKQYEVLKSSVGARRQPLLFSISTSGYVNDSIYDELMKRATRFLLGDSKESRLLPFLYMIDDIEKWNDINELQKSNPNLGVSVSVQYLLEEIAIAEGSLSKKSEFITKYCNLKQNSSLAWLSSKVVNASMCEALSLDDFRGCYCVGGIDLSQTTDLTCANVTIEKDGILYVFAKFWLPEAKLEEAIARDGIPYDVYIQRGILATSGENFVDYHDCFDWFRMLVEDYEILPLQIGYDRYSAQYLVQDMKTYGFHMDDVYQGDNLWGVIQETEGLLKDGKIKIGDNDLLKIHMLDTAIKMSLERGRGRIIKVNNNSHIDGVASLLDSMTVRQKWHTEIGEQLKNAG